MSSAGRVPALLLALALTLVLTLAAAGCRSRGGTAAAPPAAAYVPSAREIAFLDTLERRTFGFFWDLSDSATGLTPDRWPTRSFASVAATGFALTAYPIGAERGYVTRAQSAARVLRTLRFLWTARQDTAAAGATGYRGFFYHFLVPSTGARYGPDVELSTIDTALLLAGALFCQSYYDGAAPEEGEIRALAESLYVRVDWPWAMVRPPAISHGWDPREGFLPYDWRGMNESMIVPLLALGGPRALAPETYSFWESPCRWVSYQGLEHVGFPPLFGHQFTQVWLDLRGLRDSLMRAHDLDWFENSRRATLAQQAYAIANPNLLRSYGARLWGLTACDGPLDGKVTLDGRLRAFRTYAARGAPFREGEDDGTIAPAAAGGSIVFAPEIVIPTLVHMRETYGDHLFTTYGFVDALNPTLDVLVPVTQGRVVRDVGWFDTDYLGIDQGPILAMTENYRSGLVWRVMRRNPHVVRGLRAAGFTGGWLDSLGTGR